MALQMEDHIRWDDRVGLYKLIVDVVENDKTLGYAFLERDNKPYVFTFPKGIPKGLLGLGPFSTQEASVKSIKDEKGVSWLDISQAVPGYVAVLHLGINMDVLFWQAITGLNLVFAISGVVLLAGAFFAWNIAVSTTREINTRMEFERKLQLSNDTLNRLNEQLAKHALQIENANKDLESFAFSVSHDLRAPLRHIDGFVKLLLENSKDRMDEEGLHFLDVISQSAIKMDKLIEAILTFSRLGRKEMEKTMVSMKSLLQDAIRDFEIETKGRNIQWKIDELPVVSGDPALLRVVLVNLVSNALKYTRLRPIAEIEIGCLPSLETNIQENEIIFFISDNGVGFDSQYSNRLFGVFQRLHSEEEYEGTGIGLANVKKIINRHGGRVWAESVLNEGSTFFFSLPVLK
jgi:signal transduction histidine kinase